MIDVSKQAVIAAVLCVLLLSHNLYGTNRPEKWADEIKVKGIGNFYKVSDELYRGRQPTAEGIAKLKELGIKTIVNLRMEESDSELLTDSNIAYERIAIKAKTVDEADVIKFLKIATNKEKTPVFLHCRRGADRTGMMVAVYRVAVQDWTKEEAIEEMVKGGYRFSPLCRKLKTFIMNLDIEKIRKSIADSSISS